LSGKLQKSGKINKTYIDTRRFALSQNLSLPWGKDQITLDLPDQWHLLGSYEPAVLPPVADAAAEASHALAEPVACLPLRERLHVGQKIALIIDDGSRPTPVAAIYPAVLAELHAAGIPEEAITVVPAIGLHRPMPEDEIRARLGLSAAAPLHFVNPNCDDLETMVHLGTTSRGTPVWINRTVAEADFILAIGCIEPHIIASFGGGYKNIIPGVAGRLTTAHNHTLNCTSATFNMVGQPIAANPMRLDLEEGAAMLSAPVFVINAILNNHQQVVRILAGAPVETHRAGATVSAELYGVAIPHPADIIIADSHPMDQDFRQGVKALANTVRALKPGGVLITLVRAEEGVGVFGLANSKLPFGRSALKLLAPLLLPLVPRLKIKGLGEEDRFFLYFALQAMQRGDLFFYAPTIPEETQSHLPFVQFWPSAESALAAARRKFPGPAEVIVFPAGGITYPILP
jgi:nickel-dependent lactate racemase